jgi:serine/threonine protein kinase/tetratricopeptide (TPR) repeat protein
VLAPVAATLDDAVTQLASRVPAVDGSTTEFTPPAGSTTPFDPAATVAYAAAETTPAGVIAFAAHGAGPLTISQRFGRYTIVRLLGIGGMGAVYQAWDQELDVVVALKVIRPEALRDPLAEQEIERRFKRELLLARQVTHKNVVRIHDLGEIDGIKYITMTYVEGTDLATRLRQDRRLPVAEALSIMRAVVSGLIAAHAAGVVHRDLKPANIMIDSSGEALIMDFGIARSTGTPSAMPASVATAADPWRTIGRHAETTMAGTIVGTVEYMAPEQARGLPVDQRADVYAAGLILYDMLVGTRRAAEAGGAVAELRARIDGRLPTLRSRVPDIPEPLSAVVARATGADAATRFQSATELADALARLDATGALRPITRVVRLPVMVAVVSLLLVLSGVTWWYTRPAPPPVQHAPVSVLISDFQNATDDPAFDRTLEPMVRRALEGASFISAYDRTQVRGRLGVTPPDALPEAAARELAVKQGLGVVLAGTIQRQGNGYAITVRARQTVTGQEITSASATASRKDEVIEVATRLMTSVREALGDDQSESAQMFAMASLSATSLDVVRHYAAAQDAASNSRFEDARQSLLRAVQLDPKFGVGYQLLAVASRNLGRMQDAEQYINEALRYLDGMTERERLSTRGMFYRVTGDYPQCVKEYGELITRYAADVVGHNQLALCASQLRDMRRAVTEMQAVVELLPRRVLFRDNLALYANYAGDFEMAEKEARTIEEPDVYARLALAFAQAGQGQLPQAAETYQQLIGMGAQGASIAASGLGDLAAYEGRLADAVRLLQNGAAADLAANNTDRAAAKFAGLAHVHLLRGDTRAAIAAADQALANSNEVKTRFVAARSYALAGEAAKARTLVVVLAAALQAEPQAYGKIVEGVLALEAGDARQAIKLLNDANALLDTWIGHFDLGRAYLAAGQFPQADSELDRCIKRRGEALSLFLDEDPTLSYFPPVYYYQGRVREGLSNAGFADSYRAYLDIRGQSPDDPLLAEVRRRAQAR